jgi:hypothetical protein
VLAHFLTFFMKKPTVFCIVSLAALASARAQDTTYVWVSTDGNPQDISGTITLDSPSSAGGSAKDIVSFSVTDPVATLSSSSALPGSVFSDGPFTWNSSQITSMDIIAVTYIGGPFDEILLFTDNSISDAYVIPGSGVSIGFSDNSGSWQVEPVPDAGSCSVLMGAVCAGLVGLRRFRR